MNIKILKIEVFNFGGCDHINVYTDMPPPFKSDSQNLILEFKATKGTGVQYAKDNFGITPKYIGIERPSTNFSKKAALQP